MTNSTARDDAGWRPIETVPKDGTRCLLYEDGDVYAGEFDGSSPYEDDHHWRSFCGQHVTTEPEPTHWMPLPTPPALEERRG